MGLQIGIIGLPNVGKTTLLNALTHAHAEASNYPFCTIDRNVGVVAIEDRRLQSLAERLHPAEVHPAAVQFVDIAGLVRGASRGDGLGNKFLAHIREADALLHVVRAFRDEAIVHVEGSMDPVRDYEVVETELLLADLETVQRQMEKIHKQGKGDPKKAQESLVGLQSLEEALKKGHAIRSLGPGSPEQIAASGLFLLTDKPVLVLANTEEAAAPDEIEPVLAALRSASSAQVIPLAVRIEEELSRMTLEEQEALREDLGLPRSALGRIVEECRGLLGLVTFFTIANQKLQAWLVPAGTTAARAAGRIHTDMERGFIRVEVFSPEDLLSHGGRPELQRLGLIRTEGKEYRVRDGDVLQVHFHAP